MGSSRRRRIALLGYAAAELVLSVRFLECSIDRFWPGSVRPQAAVRHESHFRPQSGYPALLDHA